MKSKWIKLSIIIILLFSIVMFFWLYVSINIKPYDSRAVNSGTPSSTIRVTNFYVSNSGDDNNSGTSISKPWKTISKVNSYRFMPNDVIHFKCGDVWREQLIPSSGNLKGKVTYTSYGNGKKPSIYGSVPKNKKADWKKVSANIWTLDYKSKPGVLKIEPAAIWLWQQGIGKANLDTNIDKNLIKLNCINPGYTKESIQLNIKNVKIETNKSYKFTFKARTTSLFKVRDINLMKSLNPFMTSNSYSSGANTQITTEWKPYTVYFNATNTDNDSRITIYLGKSMAKNSTLYLKDLYFSEVSETVLIHDVGNVIFNNGKSCGIKVFSETELTGQNKFWYDKKNQNIKLYSKRNPSEIYKSIECALTANIIDESYKSYVLYKGLDLRYGGGHGIGGNDTSNIKIENCDISFIGGGVLKNYYKRVRYGNGIEFWNNAHDNIVSGCKIWQIYDIGLTNQGDGKNIKQYNITYTNNKIWNCEVSYEYYHRGSRSVTFGIKFDHNICLDAGSGWGHNQRPDPSGVHVMFYMNSSEFSDFSIINNTFKYAKKSLVYIPAKWNGYENLKIKNNKLTQSRNKLLTEILKRKVYSK